MGGWALEPMYFLLYFSVSMCVDGRLDASVFKNVYIARSIYTRYVSMYTSIYICVGSSASGIYFLCIYLGM